MIERKNNHFCGLQLPEHYPDTIFLEVDEFLRNIEIVLGYPTILLNETLIDDIYVDFQPKSGDFFHQYRKLKTMSQKPIFGLELADITRLMVDNAYFISKQWLIKTYQIGNSYLIRLYNFKI